MEACSSTAGSQAALWHGQHQWQERAGLLKHMRQQRQQPRLALAAALPIKTAAVAAQQQWLRAVQQRALPQSQQQVLDRQANLTRCRQVVQAQQQQLLLVVRGAEASQQPQQLSQLPAQGHLSPP